MQFNTGKQFDDLVENDLLANVDAQAAAQNWKAILPPHSFRRSRATAMSTRCRSTSTARTGCSTPTTHWQRAGVQPPTSWEDLFPALDKLKAAGLIPLAFSGQKNWERNLFNNVMAGAADAICSSPSGASATSQW